MRQGTDRIRLRTLKNNFMNNNFNSSPFWQSLCFPFVPALNQNSSFFGRPFDRVVTAFGSFFSISFFHFIRRFWNQVLTCRGVSFSWRANSFLPWVERYFSWSNLSSMALSCSRVNTVRVLRKRRLSSKMARKYFGAWQMTAVLLWLGSDDAELNKIKYRIKICCPRGELFIKLA